ncbi:Peroxisomal acyl-coenzyme a oxidase, partial [Globisporangium polare]
DAVDIIKSGKGSFSLKLAELHAVSSGLKAWLAVKVSDGIETCRRMCGGHGFTNSSNLGHLFAEIVGANTFEGTFDVLVQQHARYLLKALVSLPFKNADSEDSNSSSTSFLTRADKYLDPSLRCKATKPEDFANFQLLLEAFEARASRILVRLAKKMEATKNDGNACMVLMSRASTAHAELMLLEAFIKGVDTVPAGASKVALTNLCALFGSWLIVNTLGDFREDNYLSSAQGELVRQQLVRLLPVVRKNAVLLTDAWDFTDFELNSTIGRYDGDIY